LEFVKRGSSYQVATAGQKAGGRGGAISFFHGSEAAWWTNAPDHFASSVQAVDEVRGVWGVLWREPRDPLPFEKGKGEIYGWVKPPSEVWLETTSAGPVGEFFRRYTDAMKGIGRYQSVFVPWIVQQEYQEAGDFVPHAEPEEEGALSELEYQELYKLSDAQMLWRRSKIHELGDVGKFRQEYPIDVTEAPDAPLIVGVDPAGAGGDRFAVAWRRGDKILKVEYRHKLEHDEAVAWLAQIIDEDHPSRMCVDRGSMGQNIVSSLRNLNKKYADIVKGIDFGGTSRAKQANPKRAGPWNRRAEMYGDLREWLAEGGSIPDDDDLASDMSAAKQKWRANNDWLLESKTEMKARGLRSSDLSDACALTFATKEWFDSWKAPEKPKGWAPGIDENQQVGEWKVIDRTGAGDNDRYWEYSGDDAWMG
jgi:hypothetical protein